MKYRFAANMADENEEVQIVTPDFVKILDNALGAEGPVFDKLGEMFMVAPGVEKDGLPAGEILKIDLKNATVSAAVTRMTRLPISNI